jgi:hypothetical protein
MSDELLIDDGKLAQLRLTIVFAPTQQFTPETKPALSAEAVKSTPGA